MSKAKIAMEYKKRGCNCAEAVACAFCSKFNIDEETAKNMSRQYGAGRFEGVCGAVMAASLFLDKNKFEELKENFKLKNGSYSCKELKGIGTGVVLRDCMGCVEDAANILEDCIK